MGLAFADEIICTGKDKSTTIIMVDTRASVGGHWNDAYDFVKLHQPAAYYGVNSEVLGTSGHQCLSFNFRRFFFFNFLFKFHIPGAGQWGHRLGEQVPDPRLL